ncbi:MAG: response regulator [Alphaproteobacteria bacterium]|nr:response regulator [Alphaproteobacteria bacterium]
MIDPNLLAKKRIMLVEDDPFSAQLSQLMLRQIGARSITVTNDGKEALQILTVAAANFDLVISDLNMPQIGGLELLEQVRRIRPDLPFLLITGTASKETVVAAQGQGVNGYIVKPFSADQLGKKIAAVFAGR